MASGGGTQYASSPSPRPERITVSTTVDIMEQIRGNRKYQALVILSVCSVIVSVGFVIGFLVNMRLSERSACVVGVNCVGGVCVSGVCTYPRSSQNEAPGTECDPTLCNNNGQCRPYVNAPTACLCNTGFFGDRCEFRDPCNVTGVGGTLPCEQGTVCQREFVFDEQRGVMDLVAACRAGKVTTYNVISDFAPLVVLGIWILWRIVAGAWGFARSNTKQRTDTSPEITREQMKEWLSKEDR